MLVALLGLAQSPGPTIDFSHTAASAKTVIEALGEHVRAPMTASPALANDVVIVTLRKATLDDARSWLAEVLDAVWKQREGVLVLDRPEATEREQKRDYEASRFNEFTKRIADIPIAEPLDKEANDRVYSALRPAALDPGTAVNVPSELYRRLPGQRLLVRLLKDIEFAQFRGMPDGVSVYLPFTQRTADRRLSRRLRQFLADYRQEDEQFGLLVDRIGIHQAYRYVYDIVPGKWKEGPLSGALRLTARDFGFSAELCLRWGEGHPEQFHAPYFATAQLGAVRQIELPSWSIKPVFPRITSDWLMLRVPSSSIANNVSTPVPHSILDYFTANLAPELLELGSGELLRQAASLANRSIVAYLPDSVALLIHRMARRPPGTMQEAFDVLTDSRIVRAIPNETAILLKPVSPYFARETYWPRVMLGDIVRDGLIGVSRFDTFADLAVQSDLLDWPTDPREYLARVTRLRHIKTIDEKLPFVVRSYGHLNTEQRRQARNGGVFVPWLSLPAEERRRLMLLVSSEGRLGHPGEPSDSSDHAKREAHLKRIASGEDRLLGIRVEVEGSQAVVGASSVSTFRSIEAMRGMDLAWHIAWRELGADLETDLYTTADGMEVRLSVVSDFGSVKLASFFESVLPESHSFRGFDAIPASILKPLRPEIDRIKEQARSYDPPN